MCSAWSSPVRGVLPQQELQVHRDAGTWRAAESRRRAGRTRAPRLRTAWSSNVAVELAFGRRRAWPIACEPLGHPVGDPVDLARAARARPSATLAEHPGEAGHPRASRRRKVGAAEERLELGREEDRHRPAAVPALKRLDRRHVDLVEVGPLLAVDLDVDEMLVHQGRDRGVLEALVLHHVAPVAGRVADREEDRPVLGLRPGQRLGTPRDTSRPGYARAGAGRDSSRRPGGSRAGRRWRQSWMRARRSGDRASSRMRLLAGLWQAIPRLIRRAIESDRSIVQCRLPCLAVQNRRGPLVRSAIERRPRAVSGAAPMASTIRRRRAPRLPAPPRGRGGRPAGAILGPFRRGRRASRRPTGPARPKRRAASGIRASARRRPGG